MLLGVTYQITAIKGRTIISFWSGELGNFQKEFLQRKNGLKKKGGAISAIIVIFDALKNFSHKLTAQEKILNNLKVKK